MNETDNSIHFFSVMFKLRINSTYIVIWWYRIFTCHLITTLPETRATLKAACNILESCLNLVYRGKTRKHDGKLNDRI